MLSKISNFDFVLDDGASQGIRVIDWGRAINARSISSPWTGKCYTSGFVIPQMKLGRPWRYQVSQNFNKKFIYISYVLNHKFQIDLYALAMSLHLLMFGDYAKVEIKNERAGNNISLKTIKPK